MLVYDSRKWFQFKVVFSRSDTARQLLPYMFACMIYCLFVAYWEKEILHLQENSWVKNIPILHSMIGFVISLLLVFRTNTAYDRWWEGRKLWGALVNNSRNLAIKLGALLPADDEENRAFFRQSIPFYAATLKDHLQLEQTRLSLDQFPHPEFDGIDQKKHLPNQVAQLILHRIYALNKQGIIGNEQLLTINDDMTALTDICGGCERIKNTPIPFSYSIFIKRFIVIYIITLPFGYVFQLGYFVAPIVTFILFVLGSLELIAEEIEDPFGIDENDLPTDKIAANIQKHIAELL